MLIRPYTRRDRAIIRQLSCETADRGEPVERFFPDREVVADLLTNYYLEREPRSVWVAEREGRVVGYVTGCLNSRRYRWAMMWRILPGVFLTAVRRRSLWTRPTWIVMRAGVQSLSLGGFSRHVPFNRYPAHLHVNIQQGFRGQHVGRQLVEQFLHHVRAAGLHGVHVGVSEDNPRACRFFEQMGFVILSRHPIMRPSFTGGQRTSTVMYGITV